MRIVDAARGRVADRIADDGRRLRPEIEVVLGEVECPLRRAEEGRDLAARLQRLLAAVCQGADRDRWMFVEELGQGGNRGDLQLLPRRAACESSAPSAP